MKRLVLVILLFVFATALTAQGVKIPAAQKDSSVTNIRNNIKLKIKGFEVHDAYLIFDNEQLVPEDNKIELYQRVNLVLVITKGWLKVAGNVYPGAQEQISLSDGKVILKSKDLFSDFEASGISPSDAHYITLKAIITKMDDKNKYINVNFRVWDKKSPSQITGSYKLFIK